MCLWKLQTREMAMTSPYHHSTLNIIIIIINIRFRSRLKQWQHCGPNNRTTNATRARLHTTLFTQASTARRRRTFMPCLANTGTFNFSREKKTCNEEVSAILRPETRTDGQIAPPRYGNAILKRKFSELFNSRHKMESLNCQFTTDWI